MVLVKRPIWSLSFPEVQLVLGSISRFFNHNERALKRLRPQVEAVSALEAGMKKLSDDDLRAATDRFRERIAEGESLDSMMAEAFAVVREAAVRTLGQRHFDTQVMGGIVLHQGKISEMATGEGKTLAATMPAYLNALLGRGVHVVTVNDYLARRDAEWMGKIYRFLGLTVGVIVPGLDRDQRKAGYAADITYGTNNEFGFDYLRDNMVLYRDHMVQRNLHYAIIDEVDSILIDEARTPLIISGARDQSPRIYTQFARLARRLHRGPEPEKDEDQELEDEGDELRGDYWVDEKARTVTLTDSGNRRAEQELGISNITRAFVNEKTGEVYESDDEEEMGPPVGTLIRTAVRAKELMKRDRDYVINDGKVVIVDEFTGRLMVGRRYSGGLHQAIEAKENLKVERESQTVASVTFQNYFRMYDKLSGMTGTAATEEEEFDKIYGLDVVVLPTNKELIRTSLPDSIYKTEKAKFQAAADEIKARHEAGQPLLVGTVSIEKSEFLGRYLSSMGITHEILNAKHHEREAEIVAQAGRVEAVTIATNMAGRGTDILLGGNPEFLALEEMKRRGYDQEILARVGEPTDEQVPDDHEQLEQVRQTYRELVHEYERQTSAEHEKVIELGGLHIIGTERHEARRIDNQLRGRAGRQGDPGSSQFYLSLEDDLMRLFGADMIAGFMDRLGVDEHEPIDHPLVGRALGTAQKRVESRNFDLRKNLLQYDDVMNEQRKQVYKERGRVLDGVDLRETILEMVTGLVREVVNQCVPRRADPGDWSLDSLVGRIEGLFLDQGTLDPGKLGLMDPDEIEEQILGLVTARYEKREADLGPETMRELERVVLLRFLDQHWMDHLAAMDDLREGIGLRAYGQRDPLLEYKFEAHRMFETMFEHTREEVVRYIYKVEVKAPPRRQSVARTGGEHHGQVAWGGATGRASGGDDSSPKAEPVRVDKVGRNAPCPCGSGKKFKHCCANKKG